MKQFVPVDMWITTAPGVLILVFYMPHKYNRSEMVVCEVVCLSSLRFGIGYLYEKTLFETKIQANEKLFPYLNGSCGIKTMQRRRCLNRLIQWELGNGMVQLLLTIAVNLRQNQLLEFLLMKFNWTSRLNCFQKNEINQRNNCYRWA